MRGKQHSHRGSSGLFLRGDKFGKIYFRQMLEWIRRAQIGNARVITELKRLDGQRCMAGAVAAGIATIMISVLFERCTRTVASCGNFRVRCPFAGGSLVALHGMGTFMHASDRDGQHDQNENKGIKFKVDKFSHKCF